MNAATKWEIFVGLSDDKGEPIKAERVQKVFSKLVDGLTADFGGCTLTPTTGAWGAVREDSVVVSVITTVPNVEAEEFIRHAAIFLKNHLRQQAVFVSKTAIEFVSI